MNHTHRTSLLALAILTFTATAPYAAAQSKPVAAPQTLGYSDSDALSAAHAYGHQPHTTIFTRTATLNGCPVGFRAGHSNSLTQVRTGDAKPGIPSQSLNLRMDNATSHDIVSAQITLHGLSPHYRVTPANTGTPSTGDLTKQMTLALPVDAGRQAATDFRVYGFTSVQRVDLDSLTYADGTTWTASPEQRCSVVPSGMMLVAAAQ